MTKHKHYDLITAFAEGKTLQWRTNGEWHTYVEESCPDFTNHYYQWRIKPDDPKKIVIATFVHLPNGNVEQAVLGTPRYDQYVKSGGWFHSKELDREVTLPEGE